ncbi:MAG: phosphoglucosamine mutase, partial [Sphingomonadales bacterium]|nr:phosphoglucosamine mutase [Sphingomonadales bacterium]
LQVLRVLTESDKPASEMLRVFEPMPQILKNVTYHSEGIMEHKNVVEAIRDGEARLNGKGRLLIRKSGTEPVIRVMAEGDDEALINEVVDDICNVMDNAA